MVKKNSSSQQKWLFITFIAAAIFFIDQITKFIIRKKMPLTNNGILDLTFTTNTGSLFGLFDNFAYSNLVFIVLSVVAIGLLLLVFRDEENKKLYFPLGLVIGGILGNFVDRIFFASVIDWIRVPFWPVFNIADTALVIGVILLLLFTIQEERVLHRESKKVKKKIKKRCSKIK